MQAPVKVHAPDMDPPDTSLDWNGFQASMTNYWSSRQILQNMKDMRGAMDVVEATRPRNQSDGDYYDMVDEELKQMRQAEDLRMLQMQRRERTREAAYQQRLADARAADAVPRRQQRIARRVPAPAQPAINQAQQQALHQARVRQQALRQRAERELEGMQNVPASTRRQALEIMR